MGNEYLEKWEPVVGLPKKLYLKGLCDDEKGLSLRLMAETDTPVLLIRFESTLSYRNTDEGDRLKFLNEVSGDLDWSLYVVSDSEYIAWFNEQSYSLRDSINLKHFLFLTPNDVVDVLALEEPIVEYNDQNSQSFMLEE